MEVAEKQQNSGIGKVDEDKKVPAMSKHGLDIRIRPLWYDGRVVIDKDEGKSEAL